MLKTVIVYAEDGQVLEQLYNQATPESVVELSRDGSSQRFIFRVLYENSVSVHVVKEAVLTPPLEERSL